MTPRENLLAVLLREQPEHVPFCFDLCPKLAQKFRKRTGTESYEEYYDFDMRTFSYLPTQHKNDYSAYFGRLKPGTVINEWGVGHEPGSVAHFTRFLHPMENFQTPEEVYAFPVPDILADYRWEGVKERVEACQRGMNAALAAVFISLESAPEL